MTTQSPPPLTGQDINLAARAVRDVLDALLDQAQLTFPQSLALQTLAADSKPRDSLVADLADRIRADRHAVAFALDGLIRRGLVSDAADGLRLTQSGKEHLERTLAATQRATAQLYRDFAPDDLATTRRVLVELIARAPTVQVGV